jgi:hypothetical protein
VGQVATTGTASVFVTGVQATGQVGRLLVWGPVNDNNDVTWVPVNDTSAVTWTTIST